MDTIKISIKELEYERLKNILIELQEYAKYVDIYEDSCIDDYRNMAEVYKRDILDTLIELEL